MCVDRPRGILSQTDRRYLKNPEEYSKQAGYERRQAIVERVHEALHDFPLLVSELDEDLRAEAFRGEEFGDKEDTIDVLPSVFAFLYLGVIDIVEPTDLAKDGFEGLVAMGVKEAYLQRGETVQNFSADIQVETGPSFDELRERESIPLSEVFQLSRGGALPSEKTTEVVMEHIEEQKETGELGGGEPQIPADVLEPLFEEE